MNLYCLSFHGYVVARLWRVKNQFRSIKVDHEVMQCVRSFNLHRWHINMIHPRRFLSCNLKWLYKQSELSRDPNNSCNRILQFYVVTGCHHPSLNGVFTQWKQTIWFCERYIQVSWVPANDIKMYVLIRLCSIAEVSRGCSTANIGVYIQKNHAHRAIFLGPLLLAWTDFSPGMSR